MMNRYKVDFSVGICPYHWTEYVNALTENNAETEARKVFNLNGKSLGWVKKITLLEEGAR
jgi:hypothetical protein